MAAPLVHVVNEDSSDSEVIPDDFEENSDQESVEENEWVSDHSDAENDASNAGLGNVMAKILHKKIDSTSAVLAKGLTDRQIHLKRKLKEDDGEDKCAEDAESEESVSESSDDEGKESLKFDPLRVKPNPLNRDHERLLQRIATRGVVQLFNAVQKQQKTIDEKMKEAGGSEVKKSRLMKKVTKGGFMDMLKPMVKSKTEMMPENEPSWKILRDDFMMGAKLKDWDKESDDGGGDIGIE